MLSSCCYRRCCVGATGCCCWLSCVACTDSCCWVLICCCRWYIVCSGSICRRVTFKCRINWTFIFSKNKFEIFFFSFRSVLKWFTATYISTKPLCIDNLKHSLETFKNTKLSKRNIYKINNTTRMLAVLANERDTAVVGQQGALTVHGVQGVIVRSHTCRQVDRRHGWGRGWGCTVYSCGWGTL